MRPAPFIFNNNDTFQNGEEEIRFEVVDIYNMNENFKNGKEEKPMVEKFD